MTPYNPRKIDESKFPSPQEWDFVGLEDSRLTQWNGKIYGSGVRRFFPDGRGRMQVSSLNIDTNKAIITHKICVLLISIPNNLQ